MRTILESGKIKPNVAGQVLDLYNQSVNQGISPTIRTTIDSSNMIFVTVMKEKQLLYTSANGAQYLLAIRKFTPTDCFRLMGVRSEDIQKIVEPKSISDSKLYQLAGNSIVTNCLTAMFEELFFPSGESYVEKDGQLSLF